MDAAQNTPQNTQIRLEREGALAIITLDGPSKRNALGADARGALRATVRQVMYHEPEVRAIVLTGAGGHFCAGADVQQFTKSSRVRGRFNVNQSAETMSELAGGPKPVVAAVEGIAYGMGLSFAVACDLLVAARNARLCAVFARIGLLPDTGILWSLPKKIGMNHAREMLTLAREVGGEEALGMGLVNQLVEPGQALQEAKKLALELAELPPLAMAHIKSALTWRGESFHDSLRAELDFGHSRGSSSMSEAKMPKVQVRKDGAVAIVTLNDPLHHNAWSADLQLELLSAIQRLMDDEEDVRAIVLTGADGQFCTGPTGAKPDEAATPLQMRERSAVGTRLVRAMWAGAKPVIAAVEGGCTGAGLSLAAACDMAFGARDSHYACTFVQHGLMPALGLIWTLPQKVGAGKARELMLRGTRIDAEEAARMGLLTAVCEPGQTTATAVEQAQQLAQLPPVTLMLLKGAMVNAMNSVYSAGRHEIDLAPVVRGADEHKEAVAASLGKRRQQFHSD